MGSAQCVLTLKRSSGLQEWNGFVVVAKERAESLRRKGMEEECQTGEARRGRRGSACFLSTNGGASLLVAVGWEGVSLGSVAAKWEGDLFYLALKQATSGRVGRG